MGAKEREARPTRKFVDDYNNLRLHVVEAKPALAKLLPPRVEFIEGNMGLSRSDSTYAEVQAYCEQIVGLINAE